MRQTPEKWEKIRLEFVQGVMKKGVKVWPSMAELSRKYKLAKPTIGKKSKDEGWLSQRTLFCESIKSGRNNAISETLDPEGRQITSLNADKMSRLWVRFDLRCLKVASDGLAICQDKINELKQSKRTNAYILQGLATAIEKFQTIGKKAVGDSQGDGAGDKTAVIIFNEIKGGSNESAK